MFDGLDSGFPYIPEAIEGYLLDLLVFGCKNPENMVVITHVLENIPFQTGLLPAVPKSQQRRNAGMFPTFP
jgi:hypothetical protein